jgi:hypothetical protein
MPEDVFCTSGRYCFMEDFARYWAQKQGDCQPRGSAATCGSAAPACAWDASLRVCYSTKTEDDYAGIPAVAFVAELKSQEWKEYQTRRHELLAAVGRQFEVDLENKMTGWSLNTDGSGLQFAFISFNATYPRQNTVDQANEWFSRWETFRETHGFALGGFQTTELYLFMVTQNEMVKAATMGILLSLLVTVIVMTAATMSLWLAALGAVNIVAITVIFLGIVPLIGWSLGENECIFLIATVGLSVDYTVHLLHSYNSAQADSRQERVRLALSEMGISVANSAITTLLSAAILFGCGFNFFFQFGGFIFIVIGLSILLSTNLLMPLLLLFGPEGEQGRLRPCASRLFAAHKQGDAAAMEATVVGAPETA